MKRETWTTYADTEAITWERNRHGIARAIKVERDDHAAITPSPDRDCPRCGATGARPCISAGGNSLSTPHKARAFGDDIPECENCSRPAATRNSRFCVACKVARDLRLWRERKARVA